MPGFNSMSAKASILATIRFDALVCWKGFETVSDTVPRTAKQAGKQNFLHFFFVLRLIIMFI